MGVLRPSSEVSQTCVSVTGLLFGPTYLRNPWRTRLEGLENVTIWLETKPVVCPPLASGLTGDGGEGCIGLEEPMAVFPGILLAILSKRAV